MSTTFKKPMLAASLLKASDNHDDATILKAMEKLKYPVLATLKIDGIRAIKYNGQLVSRTLKLIPNKSIRERASKLPEGFDMELYNSNLAYDEIESIVMSREHAGSDEIQFHVLDYINEGYKYQQRCGLMMQICKHYNWPDVQFISPTLCENAQQLYIEFQKTEYELGEGLCFRLLDSPYKQNRSTLREQYLVKLCRNITSEAEIIGFIEQFENANPTKRNAVGSMDRSSSQHNLHGKNTLGALVVRDLKTKQEFKIGTGFNDDWRNIIWDSREAYLGKIVVYRSKGHGQKIKPRCPTWKGMRQLMDIV